jgi:precorrin-3B synthase
VVTTPVRDRADACPGALRTHRAADGLLVRLRLPGGRLSAAAARGLAAVAARYADGAVHLTSRGNVQLRGVREVDGGADPALVAAVQACGLLPSPTHELVRNIIASPWSGRRGGLVDVEPLVAAVDQALCGDPTLAALPGRFLIALDDGSGDVTGLGADVTWWAQDGRVGALLIAGHDLGLRVPVGRVAATVVEVARAFLRVRADCGAAAWHIAELPGGADALAAELALGAIGSVVAPAEGAAGPYGAPASDARSGPLEPPRPRGGLPELGTLPQADGRWGVAALVPLGRIDCAALHLLADAAELGSGRLVVTPWREVIVTDVGPDHLADVERLVTAAELVTDATSPWRQVSACVGRPSCGRALADVRAMAVDVVAALGTASSPAPARVHLAGCGRRCGRPAAAHREIVAETSGYTVADVGPATADGERPRQLLLTAAAADPPRLAVRPNPPSLSEDP